MIFSREPQGRKTPFSGCGPVLLRTVCAGRGWDSHRPEARATKRQAAIAQKTQKAFANV